jgi:hypothetical protein
MINLIPEVVRTAIVKEYWVRVVTVAFFMFSAVLVAVVLIASPVYVLITTQVDAYATSANEAAMRVADFDVSSSELVRANQMSAQIAALESETKFMDVVNMVELVPKTGIEISSYSFNRSGGKVSPIQIAGVAETRQTLAAFRDELLKNDRVLDAVLPISNLAKDKDLDFLLTVTIK